jgi:glycosyltransferase involved in cell wall biosynthesis
LNNSVAILGSRGYPSTYGGFETLVRRLAPYLRDRGLDVSVYARGGTRQKDRSEMVDGIRVISTPGLEMKSTTTLSHGLTASFDAGRRRYRSVLVLNVAHGFLLRRLRESGARTIVNVDGLEWDRGKWGILARTVLRAGAASTARHAHTIVADSEVVASYWQSNFHRSPVYVPYGADVISDVPTTHLGELGLKPGYILMVARIVPENNVGLLLEALKYVSDRIPVVVVGSSNYRNSEIQRLEATRSSRRNFHWLGHISDQDQLHCLWAHCGVYYHGHSVGGTNPALLQAMGLGAPVVAFASDFNREVLSDGGLYVGSDARVLAETLRQVLDDSSLRNSLRERALQRVAARYRWVAVYEAYYDLLTVAEHGPRPPSAEGGPDVHPCASGTTITHG